MYDSKLPFGARASPTIFHRLSQAIKRLMFRKGFHKIVAYQDDFLIIGESYSQCYEAWVIMLELLNRLGLQINKEKLSEPSQNVVFLGILLITISCTASLPPEKLDQIRNEVNLFLKKCRASKHQLQSIAGRLNFASQVVHRGRTFLRRILDSIVRLKRPFHKVKIQGTLW